MSHSGFFLKVTEICQGMDELCILEIKHNKFTGSKKDKIAKQILELANSLIHSLGKGKFDEIYKSSFYQDLYYANEAIFDTIDKLEDESNGDFMDAHIPHNLNKERFSCKAELQKHYFGEIEEVKTGI